MTGRRSSDEILVRLKYMNRQNGDMRCSRSATHLLLSLMATANFGAACIVRCEMINGTGERVSGRETGKAATSVCGASWRTVDSNGAVSTQPHDL
jgi:hypothetical protein